jgi:hypothetical protein
MRASGEGLDLWADLVEGGTGRIFSEIRATSLPTDTTADADNLVMRIIDFIAAQEDTVTQYLKAT